MLTSRNLNDKTYEQFIEEAFIKIPLYCNEWTNHNSSDPGITILENLSAFATLQQSEVNEVSDNVRKGLLALAGFECRQGKPARTLILENGAGSDIELIPAQKIYSQGICYEFDGIRNISGGHIVKTVSQIDKAVIDYSSLVTEFGVPKGEYIFGKVPKCQNSIEFYIDKLPKDNDKLIFYISTFEEFDRNPVTSLDYNNPFAELEWSMLTDKGFQTVKVSDYTYGFLFSGSIIAEVCKDAVKNSEGCYVLRAEIKRADYDIPPRLKWVRGLLTEIMQKDTCLWYEEATLEEHHIVIKNQLLKDGNLFVYGFGDDGFYNEYLEAGFYEMGEHSYYYERNKISLTESELIFRTDKYTKVPYENKIIIVIGTRDIMPRRYLGQLYGYDEQEFSIRSDKPILNDTLVLMAEITDDAGEKKYLFVRPGDKRIRFRYIENKKKIVIDSCGDYEGAKLWLASGAMYDGENGNVLAGNSFELSTQDSYVHSFTNYDAKVKGCFAETTDMVVKRFAKDMRTPKNMVTEKDCELIVSQIEGLSIHKIKAYKGAANEICIAIKPNSLNERPRLSDIYKEKVREYLEDKRMLTTRISVIEPHYEPIDITLNIFVKKHYENIYESVNRLLESKLNQVNSDIGFGEKISFSDIYIAISALEGVVQINDLRLMPHNMAYAAIQGTDIYPAANCLCYVGNINVEVSNLQ